MCKYGSRGSPVYDINWYIGQEYKEVLFSTLGKGNNCTKYNTVIRWPTGSAGIRTFEILFIQAQIFLAYTNPFLCLKM